APAQVAGAAAGKTAPEAGQTPEERRLEKEGFRRFRDPFTTYVVGDLAAQINLLNLLNGLYLSDEQAIQVTAFADRATRVRRDGREEIGKRNREMAAALRRMRDALAGGGYAPAAYEDTAYKNGARDWQRACERLYEAAARTERELAELEEELRGVLTDTQVQIVGNYQSCLIPKQDMKDPARIGQASENGARYLESLTAARAAAAPRAAATRALLLDQYVAYWEHHHVRLTPEGKAAVAGKIAGIVERARRLSAVEWELTRNDLAREIEAIELPGAPTPKSKAKAADALKDAGSPPQFTKLGRFLLDPLVPGLLTERLRASRRYEKSGAVDFETLESAPTCGSGHCAID
ncbi:MAG: hypothetical protein HZA54_15775, partial [Planctomycetes bacterium]|nr:hypothetical protein [Planctomycetota bacterium]